VTSGVQRGARRGGARVGVHHRDAEGTENCIGNTAHASLNCFLTQSRQDAKNCMGWGELERGGRRHRWWGE